MDITLLTCNYNTPELVINLLKSVKTTCKNLPNVVVMDTSSSNSEALNDLGITNYLFRNGIHGEAVNLGLQKIKTRYVLLVDSDVIFLKDFSPAFERFKSSNLTIMGKVVGDCAGKKLYPRVEPWYCFIDLFQLKSKKISFFDRDRSKKDKSKERIYDIGSTIFEDISNAGLLIGDVDLEGKYFKHYGGMSWREQKYDPSQSDTDIDFGGTHPNKNLYDFALYIKDQYKRETFNLKEIDIKNTFK